jgi:hypothetical protein
MRQQLPDRRHCTTFAFQCGTMNYVATVAYFADGRLAEIFLTNHKSGSDADAAARDSAVVCSIALQYGVPLATIHHALLRYGQGQPSTPLGCALDLIVEGRAP